MFTSYNTKSAILAACLVLAGCATQAPGTSVVIMDHRDLESFRVDCSKKEAQIQFLETNLDALRPSGARYRYAQNIFQHDTVSIINPRDQHQHIASGMTEALLRRHLHLLRTYCP